MAHEKFHVICENLCLEEGMTKGQIQDLVSSVSSGSPKGSYTSTTELKTANPDSGVYIVTSNGHIYSWTKNQSGDPIDLGVYQAAINPVLSEAHDKGLNILNEYPLNLNGYIGTNGVLVSHQSFKSSNFIPVNYDKIVIYGALESLQGSYKYVNCYNINKGFLGTIDLTETDTTNHIYKGSLRESTCYIRVTNKAANADITKLYYENSSFNIFKILPDYIQPADTPYINRTYCVNNEIDSVTKLKSNRIYRVGNDLTSDVISDMPVYSTNGSLFVYNYNDNNSFRGFIFIDYYNNMYHTFGKNDNEVQPWKRVLTSAEESKLLKGTPNLITSQYCETNNIHSVKELKINGIYALSSNLTDEIITDLPSYGNNATLVKFNYNTVASSSNQFCLYLYHSVNNKTFINIGTGSTTIGTWKEIASVDDLKNKTINYSAFAGFKKFGVIGDSLSVGHMNTEDTTAYARNIWYSWPQYLARKLNTTCLNFGFSGATTKSWYDNAYHGYIELQRSENLCQAYIVGIGTNDNLSTTPLGSMSDIDWNNRENNADTFYGNYAKILQAINEHAPGAKIFILTLPYPRINNDKNTAMRTIAADSHLSNIIVVDLQADYDSFYRSDEINNFANQSHFTPAGYANLADLMNYILNDVMTKNASEFIDIFRLPYGSNDVIN